MSTSMLHNVHRQRVLFELSLVNSPEETVHNKLTILASKVIGTPMSLVSMVASDYQYFKSHVGLPDDLKISRRTPFSHSFCKHVVQNNQPLIVPDAREDKLVRNNLAIRDLNVIGYLGIPLTLEDGQSLGSFCVIDHDVREWTDVEIGIMTELAAIITKEFDARAYTLQKRMSKEDLADLQDRIIAFADSIDIEQPKPMILQAIRAQRTVFDLL